jgi:hypothetical protein
VSQRLDEVSDERSDRAGERSILNAVPGVTTIAAAWIPFVSPGDARYRFVTA